MRTMRHNRSASIPCAAAERVIDSYLARIAAALPGPGSARAAILAELRAGLVDATVAHRRAGLAPIAAAEAASGEFGDAAQVAAAFRPELAANQARRVAVTLLVSGPLLVVVWAAAGFGSHLGARLAPPWQWAGAPWAWRVALPLAAAAFLCAVWAAVAAVAATGRLTRWLPDHPLFASVSAAIAGLASVAVDLILLLLLIHQLARAPHTLDATPVALAATVSLARLNLAQRGGRRCLAVRADLTG
jgi:hypothetical protein